MKQTNYEELKHQRKFFNPTQFVGILVMLLTTFMATSCSDDKDDPVELDGLIGTWVAEESYDDNDGSKSTMKITLTFNKDNTGSIEEDWKYESRASSLNSYSMKFSWSTTSDANGTDILRVSYVSGDKDTELFPGISTTALWTNKYVVTGNILNIYGGDGVWVLKKL